MSINTDWCTAKDALDYETSLGMASKYDLNKRDDLLAFVFDILDYQSARSAYLCETLAAEHPDGADRLPVSERTGKDMSQIKTWAERCEEHPDHNGIVTHRMIQQRMQEEIDELRAAIEQAEDAVIAEREACAKVCEANGAQYRERASAPSYLKDIDWEVARIANMTCDFNAAAIRSRGEG